MLFYRPLLWFYGEATPGPARRTVLRNLLNPLLHCDPEEILEHLNSVDEEEIESSPDRLFAEVAFREQRVQVRLMAQDPWRKMGGRWTSLTVGQSLEWMRMETSLPQIAAAVGQELGPVALELLDKISGPARALLLAALGDLGSEVGLSPLRSELLRGQNPGPAAVGLGRLGTPEAADCLLPAVQSRGIDKCEPWLGLALATLASAQLIPLLTRVARSDSPTLREQAARALEGYGAHDITSVLEVLGKEKDPYNRMSLFLSLARLGVPGGVDTLRRLALKGDAEFVRVATIRAAGAAVEGDVRGFLEPILQNGSPIERREALEALVCREHDGAPFLEEARAAARSLHPRTMLTGLLALSVWAPEEAFSLVSEILSRQDCSEQWSQAVFVLRYLKTDQTAPLLTHLCRAAAGTELEEFALTSLARHLSVPGVAETLISLIDEKLAYGTARKILEEISHHLPIAQADEAANRIRERLTLALDPLVTGELLVALGALGSEEDLPRLSPYLSTPMAVAAIRSIELLRTEQADQVLMGEIESDRPEVREAAILSLFRLGNLGSIEHLRELASSPADRPRAAHLLLEMGLAVRCSKRVPRLLSLYKTLCERIAEPVVSTSASKANSKPRPDAPPTSADTSWWDSKPDEPKIVQPLGLQSVMQTTRPFKLSRPQTLPTLSGKPSRRSDLYRSLIRDPSGGEAASHSPRLKLILTFVAVVVVSILLKYGTMESSVPKTVDTRPNPVQIRSSALLCYASGERSGSAVSGGDVIKASLKTPITLRSGSLENSLVVLGRLKIATLEPIATHLRDMVIATELLEGCLKVDFNGEQSKIRVEADRSVVDISRGKVRLSLNDGSLTVFVYYGQAQVLVYPGDQVTIHVGQRATFRKGKAVGRTESFAPSADPW